MEGKMNRKNNIGLGKGFHSSRSFLCFTVHDSRFTIHGLCFALFTVCCLLVAGFMLLFAPCIMAADKLVVKDTDQNTKFVVTDEGTLILNTDTSDGPSWAKLYSAGDNENVGMNFDSFGNDAANSGGAMFRRARGNQISKQQVQIDDRIGFFVFGGYDGAAFLNTAGLTAKVDGVVSSGNVPVKLVFETNPTGYPRIERMVITSSGNVGIGTSNPQGKLDVNGAIYQRGGILHADYIFEPTYKMESIEEHARYMWKNKHLMAVPGVRKDENGQEIVEVGSQQRGILEELEKAHIYIDQLNEKVKALEAKLKALESIK